MARAHIKRRALKSGFRWIVYYRLNGRDGPLEYAGSFRSLEKAEEQRDWIHMRMAAGKPLRGLRGTRKTDRPEIVYFARLGDLIKIGVSKDPRRRAKDLNAELIHLEHGGRERERELHRAFKDARIRGEWFDANYDRIQRYLKNHGCPPNPAVAWCGAGAA